MNIYAVRAIFKHEMVRMSRTIAASVAAPIVSTALYFVVFGSAIGSRITDIEGIAYAAFIVPGLIMLSILNESMNNASYGIYMPKFNGTIYEVLTAPVSYIEIILGYVGSAAVKSMLLSVLILATASFFVPIEIKHPFLMFFFLILTSVSFSLFGFVVGIWADSWQKLQVVPALVVTPLIFLGGSFYSINMLPGIWQKISLFNPVVYLISGFRWSFYEQSDVSLATSLTMIFIFLIICISLTKWMLKSGYHLRT